MPNQSIPADVRIADAKELERLATFYRDAAETARKYEPAPENRGLIPNYEIEAKPRILEQNAINAAEHERRADFYRRAAHLCREAARMSDLFSREQLDAILAEHVDGSGGDDDDPWCAKCHDYLPCKPLSLAMAVRAMLAEPEASDG